MKSNTHFCKVFTKTVLLALILLGSGFSLAEDLYFYGGISADIDYTVDGWVIIEDANVAIYNPAHIYGTVMTGSGAVVDIYGGQIDAVLFISTSHIEDLPEGLVTIYASDFAVDGDPVDPNVTELFIPYKTLSGIYYDGTPFSFFVDCVVFGSPGNIFQQTIKLGWLVSEPDIELSQSEFDFGQTYIGDTKSETVTVYNVGDAALTVQSLSIEQDEPAQFDFASLYTLPFTLDPNTAVEIEILYTPVTEGLASATFTVFSDDPNDPSVKAELIGQGVAVVLSPEEQITRILDIYGAAVEEGSIQVVGNEKSGENKVKVFGKMLSVADELLLAGYDEYALETLLMIEAKCDGQKAPKDFIEGPGAEELNALINELIDTLQQ